MEPKNKFELLEKIAFSFRPSAPIDSRAFSGRESQVTAVLNACAQRGQHVVIYGERGAGKTSLVNTICEMLRAKFVMPECGTINCDQTTTFASLWRSILSEIPLSRNSPVNRSAGNGDRTQGTYAQLLPDEVTPHSVRTALQNRGRFLFIIDEVDRIKDPTTTTLLADTIKTLSDHATDATLVLVGVAESVDALLAEHESIQRALIQVHMPRMTPIEIDRLVESGLANVGMTIDPEAKILIQKLSQGLPHYAHLLGMHSAMAAASKDSPHITIENTHHTFRKALKYAQQSIADDYERATTSSEETLFRWVLLACALTETDKYGYFTPADVVKPMTMIMKKEFPVSLFSKHLHSFCEPKHGMALQRTETARGYKYKFRNAIMQPYVLMKGIEARII
jgi:type II secretory pathway predicted ATPase ExeA